jgi:hypothetical protein
MKAGKELNTSGWWPVVEGRTLIRQSAQDPSVDEGSQENRLHSCMYLAMLVLILTLGLAHAVSYKPSEPFFNNDETRHVMTGVFFRDLLVDLPVGHLHDYTINYYLQYPALGLLVWPPFFYLIEGLFMAVFGMSLIVPKILIGIFAGVACVYLFRLVQETHDLPTATMTVLIFGFSPLVFSFSRQVMLEVPTLACSLAAIYYFIRYLKQEHRRDLYFATLASTLAALTRFDGAYLFILFVVLLIIHKRLELLRHRYVLVAASLALLFILPVYALTAIETGWLRLEQMTRGIFPHSLNLLSLERLAFYPAYLPAQMGWFALVPAVIGLLAGMSATRRWRLAPYFAIVISTYLTFTMMAELDSRHVIYWTPAFSLFAASGIDLISSWLQSRKVYLVLSAIVMATTAGTTLIQPRPFVRGYEAAARYVLSHSGTSRVVLFDGDLNGNFIYQVRRHDPDRRLWVLRGDRLFFSVLFDPSLGYQENVTSDQDFFDIIANYGPNLILVEEPRTFSRVPIGDRFRALLRNHPDRFSLETVIPIDSNVPGIDGAKLEVYLNTVRNQGPRHPLEVQIPILRRSLRTHLPPQTGARSDE